jgi:[acyl-carrier-protein] S-malonyltransferase
LSDTHSAFIFPAFNSDYTDHPGRNIPGFNDRFDELRLRAASAIDQELEKFNFTGRTFQDDELRTQYLTYIYSCAASSVLKMNGLYSTLNAGYSMGIYASVFDAGAISFETGLFLIKIAYQTLHASLNNEFFGMGTLIGLDDVDIQKLIDHSSLKIEITNQNAPYSYVVSGNLDDIRKLMDLAKEEGALHTRDLAVSIPYHSSHLKSGAMEFARQISHFEIKAPETPMISLIDQVTLSTPALIREELIRNLFQPLNWFRTMNAMLENKISVFIECGSSKGLVKNSKFVDGSYRFYALNSVPQT